jgi:hypothetical protein
VRWLALVVALAGCRDAFDPSKPIDVIASGAWTDAQRADLDHAATCWNLGFGMDYRTDSADDEQQVRVEFDELMCLNPDDWAWTSMGFDTKVTICPDYFAPGAETYPDMLFGVLTHELGHVAGIPVQVADPSSIMGGGWPRLLFEHRGEPVFSPEDHALFAQYNPDTTLQPVCEPVVDTISDVAAQCACPMTD